MVGEPTREQGDSPLTLNAQLAKVWPPIVEKKDALPDADDWAQVKSKRADLDRGAAA